IGGPIVGWVSDIGGPRAGVALGGIACLAAAAYGRYAMQDVPRRRRPEPQVVEDPMAEEPVALAD
ncbi:MAG: MFS transporter, partial [Acidimicrobiia bacterium]|nr:MFS transporter [Acidimicrobiia bacterium]